ncbi:MAG: VWA domain-containing protein [Candidatus Bathyarchaeia archaeon]
MAVRRKRLVYPFTAIVGLEKLKLAILINAINPKIGGVLIRGPKGSGKSTIVRALADILPKITVVKDCPFNCNPYDPSNMCPKCSERYTRGEQLPVEERDMVVVDLPLGSTEDRVVGSLDVEKAIKYGIEALEPGILAEANQNILYVDEVNLLPDHIADDLLDAAATGWNIVEREGISVSHPSRFIFIGTMNPEEGELRPQLLDRFPLSVTVEPITSAKDRMEIVKRNMEFEANPEKFYEKYKPMQEELRNRIIQARKMLEKVVIPDSVLEAICSACLELKVDGMRPDIVIAKAAAALAAFENRTEVTLYDVLVAAELALSHRTREGGFLEPATPQEIREVFTAKLKKVFEVEKVGGAASQKEPEKRKFLKGKGIFLVKRDATEKEGEKATKDSLLSKARAILSSIAKIVSPSKFFLKMGKIKAKRRPAYAGRRAQTVASLERGKPYGWKIPRGKPVDIHLPASIRESARKQKSREKPADLAIKLCLEDIREKLRLCRAPATIVFVVDLSGSMLFNIEAVREALLGLHSDAYRCRDRVGIVALKDTGAVTVQHPITNLRVVAKKLIDLKVSGYTPLAAGMLKAWEVLKEEKRRNPSIVPIMVLVTDGSANVPLRRSLETGDVREIDEIRIILREYEDLAIKDVISVSKLIRREGIHTIIVNTNPHLYGRETYGFFVTKAIANITRGSHYEIGKLTTPKDMVKNMIELIREDQRRIVSEKTAAKLAA